MTVSEISHSFVVNSNVPTIEESQVIGLLGQHHPENVKKACQVFNKNIILQLYKPGDTILVEDSFKEDKLELLKKSIEDIPSGDFRVKGWDEPFSCEAANVLKMKLNLIVKAINVLQSSSNNWQLSEYRPALETLIKFLNEEKVPLPMSEQNLQIIKSEINEIDSRQRLSLEIQAQMLIHCASTQIQKIRSKFIISTFPTRQNSLDERIVYYLKKRPKNKIFVLMGKCHGMKTIPEFNDSLERSEKLLQSLATFTILNGYQNKLPDIISNTDTISTNVEEPLKTDLLSPTKVSKKPPLQKSRNSKPYTIFMTLLNYLKPNFYK